MYKNVIFVAVAVAGVVAVASLWPKQTCEAKDACGAPQAKLSRADSISSEVTKRKALLVDVREPSEFASGHAVDAQNIPLGNVQAGGFNENDKSKPIYVYCRSGQRAGVAKIALEKQGYTNVENLGGLNDWLTMGGKTTR